MAVIFAFLFFLFVANTSFAANVADFIEFTPIAAVSNGYAFGTSEIKINNSTFYTLSFKKGKDVFALVPDDMLYGTYPNLEYTGLAINDNVVIVGGKEKSETAYPWVFLFQIQKERVAFLDIISAATVNDYVFNFEYQLPNIHAPKNIQDLDKDGIKEFGLDFYELGVNIFIEVHNDGLKIDYLNPIYNQRFNSLDTINEKDDFQFIQYLVYGTLAKRLNNKQSDKMYVGYIRESNYKLKQLITNVRRIKELAVEYKVANNVMEYLMWDMEQKALFNLLDKKGNSTEFKQRILLLDEQLKLLKIDEVILNDLSTYIGGYLSDKEFADILTRAVVPIYKDIKLMLSNILTLDNILHKYGYKIIYLKASI